MENPSSEQKELVDEPYSNVLYVADLPNETTNDDLQKMFQDYHFHFASLNNFKHNQVWAQVYLENKDWANKARHELNGYILKPMNGANSMKEGKPVRICKYEGKGQNRQTNIKQSLLIKNIDNQMTQKEFYKIFLEYGDIVSGKIEYDENGESKGFGYIYYYTEESAENAKKNLNGKFYYSKPLEIVNLIPGKKTKTNAITLFVLNIPSNISEKELLPIFEKFGPVSNISVNQKGFAYVSYMTFEGATNCLRQMKLEPISFPGMPNIVVKNASSKEEREANKNFMKNNEAFNYGISNLNIQFNSVYYNENIKTDIDLDKEIRLFIKVVMLSDFSPKDVLVDLELMSGLVQFEKFKDYNLFLKKYQELCQNQIPIFQCIPYNYPFPSEENQNQIYNMYYNNNNIPYNNYGNKNMTPGPYNNNYNNMQRDNNFRNMNMNNNLNNNNNYQNFQNMPQRNLKNNNNINMGSSYQQNFNQKNNNNNNMNNNTNNNNKYYNGGNKNNNGSGNFAKNRYNNNKRQNNNYNNNYNNNNQNNNNNRRYYQRNNDNNNNNINNNNNRKYIIRPGDNINLNNMKQNMINPYQMNPFMNPQMMQKSQWNKNYQKMNQNNNNNNYFNDINKKNDIDIIAQRDLEKLNPMQLQSQFNKPPINVYENMFNSNEQEEIRMEIADTIYEIVSAKYPVEASKITGMINEKGIEKMNMLLSKKEDLDEIIDKAYEMIQNSKKSENEDSKFG